ncbi:RHS repeat-associated core domain-containing protein [Corallincola spongiicola]|nr:right-handed parallel beta-helix repeat-containing protein [Corallincola spongiicola]
MRFYTVIGLLLWACHSPLFALTLDADTVLASGEHTYSEDLVVPTGVTLTIEPGAKLVFSGSRKLKVEQGAVLLASGTLDRPVVFTSNALSPTKGSWGGIHVYGGRAADTIQFDHVRIEYATYGINLSGADVKARLTNSELHSNTYGVYGNGSETGGEFHDNYVHDNSYGYYFNWSYGSPQNGIPISIHGNDFEDNSTRHLEVRYFGDAIDHVIDATGNWWGSDDPYVIASKIYDGQDSLSYSPWVDFSGYLDSPSGTPVAGDMYLLPVTENTVWHSLNGRLLRTVPVLDGATLTIAEGTVIEAEKNAGLTVQTGAQLHLSGSADNPVTLTSSSLSPKKGDWFGIKVEGQREANSIQFSHAIIEYATYGLTLSQTDTNALIADSEFRYNSYGIYFNGARTGGQVYANYLHDNQYAIYLNGGSSVLADHPTPTFRENRFEENNYHLYTLGFRDELLATVDAKDNWWGSQDLSDINRKIYDSQDSTNQRPTVDFSGFWLDPDGTVSVGTQYLKPIVTDTTWSATDGWVLKPVKVANGATLTLAAGTQLKFSDGAGLTVEEGSSLRIQGTEAQPVFLTSDREQPSKGSWQGITVKGQRDADSIVVEHAKLAFASYALKLEAGAKAILRDSYLHDNTYAIYLYGANSGGEFTTNQITENSYGFYVYGGNASPDQQPVLTVSRNSISDNTSYNFYVRNYGNASSSVVDVRQNWWGSAEPSAIDQKIYDQSDTTSAPWLDFTEYLLSEGGQASGGTQYGVGIFEDTIWDAPDGVLLRKIKVSDGATLSVIAGAYTEAVKNAEIIVEQGANLHLLGSAPQPVVFTSIKATPAKNDWAGITIRGVRTPDSVTVRYAEIAYASKAINLSQNDTAAQVEDSALHDSTYGVYVYGQRVDASIQRSNIQNNGYGVYISGANGVLDNHPRVRINHSRLESNSSYNVYASSFKDASKALIDATNNWWGTAEPNQINNKLYDYQKNNNSGAWVDFRGYWLDASGEHIASTEQLLGSIHGETRLSGSYELITKLFVEPGASLVFAPGTDIRAHSQTGITVRKDASLISNGASVSQVVLRSAKNDASPSDWIGVTVESDNAQVAMRYTRISDADKALNFYGKRTKGTVTQSTLSDNHYGVYVYGGNSYFNDHPVPVVSSTQITGNTSYGYYSSGFYDGSLRMLNARGNAWGTMDEASIESLVYHHNDYSRAPIVDFGVYRTVGSAPILVSAEAPATTYAGMTVNLSGSDTIATMGDVASYEWRQLTGPVLELIAGDNGSATFISPDLDTAQLATLLLTVTDSNGVVATEIVNINLAPLTDYNQPPAIQSMATLVVDADTAVVIAPEVIDGDGDTLSYHWEQLSGPEVSLVASDRIDLEFTSPSLGQPELMSFALTVSDGYYDVREVYTVGARARRESTGEYYFANDHLGTPQRLTDSDANLVWDAVYTPFGLADVKLETVTNNLRFPGQYYDGESGLHYNYFRDYDPNTGRYIQSDPIGLNGGLNTYGYVGGNPLRFVDPTGEIAILAVPVAQFVIDALAVGIGIVMMIDDRPEQLQFPAASERLRYKDFCNNPPPETGNRCHDKRAKIEWMQTCRDMRQQWDDRYFPGRHEPDIRDLDKGIRKLKRQYARSWECKDEPLDCD